MFIGHYAVALAAKKAAPKVSLGTLFIAAQLVDLLWPLFLLAGLESVTIEPGNTVVTPLDFSYYPFTHSLVAALLWSAGFAALFFALRRDRDGALILGGVVFSHWILDLITHRPDLPLGFAGSTYFGLGLWNSLPGTLIAEFGLFAAGIYVYLQATNAKDRVGVIGFWCLVVLLGIIYLGNVFGPPPPSASMIAVAGNAAWLFVLWAYWVDSHRTSGGLIGTGVSPGS